MPPPGADQPVGGGSSLMGGLRALESNNPN